MIKRLWAWMLTLAMVLSMSTVVLAADATVYIAGTAYTKSDNLPKGVEVDWDANTITLENANLTVSTEDEGKQLFDITNQMYPNALAGIAILDSAEWEISLKGSNTVAATAEYDTFNEMIGEAQSNGGFTAVFGIYSQGSVKIINEGEEAGSLDITATYDFPGYAMDNYLELWATGIFANELAIEGCTVTVKHVVSETTVDGETVANYSTYGAIDCMGNVSIKNATVTAETNSDGGRAIDAFGDVTIENSTVTATATNDQMSTFGINAGGNVTISESAVEVDVESGRNGIFAMKDVSISGEETKVKADSSIHGTNRITIESGSVQSTGSENIALSAGKDLTISGGTVKIDDAKTTGISGKNVKISSGNIEVEAVNNAISISANGEAEISTGSYEGAISAAESAKVSISDGEYSEPVNPDYLADNINVELESNGTYTYHESVDEALEEANSGDEIALVGTAATEGAAVGGTTVKLPEGEKMIVGEEEKVTLPAGTTVKAAGSEEEKTLETGGTIDSEGKVEETVTTPEPTPTPSSNKSSKPKYSVDVDKDDIDNGSVKLSSTRAKKGSTVTITVTPDEGYVLDELVVLDDDGNEVELTDKGNGKFTFVMPKGGVSVEASFEEIEDEPVVDEPVADEKEEKTIVLTIGQQIILIDGEYVVNDVAPIIRGERTVLPIRVIAEALGATVTWNEAEQSVTIVKGDTEIVIYIDQAFALVNGEPVQLDVPAFIENDRTYLPLRFIMENLGADVVWDGVNQTVTIVG